MAKTLYFLKYNNYANRIIKREDDLEDYLDASYNHTYIQIIPNCKLWNPNDGVSTVITTPINTDFSIEPDYLLVVDGETLTSPIDSKWFITETVRLMSGQYQCKLRRDVFAEAWPEFVDATCRINRAILTNSSPLNYNPEPIAVNQILTEEKFIKDKTNCPWFVFYGRTIPAPVTVDTSAESYNLSTNDHAAWETAHEIHYCEDGDVQVYLAWKRVGENDAHFMPMLEAGTLPDPPGVTPGSTYTIDNNPSYTPEVYHNASTANVELAMRNHIRSMYDLRSYTEGSSYYDLYRNKILYDTTDHKYYKINMTIVQGTQQVRHFDAPNPRYGDVSYWPNDSITDSLLTNANYFVTAKSNIGYYQPPDPASKPQLYYSFKPKLIQISLTETVPLTGVTAKVPEFGISCKDAPYYMWCLPYGNINININGTTCTTDKDLNLAVVSALSLENSSSSEYDFQILPFCPLPGEYIQNDGSIKVLSHPEISDPYTIMDSTNTMVGAIFACPYSSFTTTVDYSEYTSAMLSTNKLMNLIHTWRIYAPNYSSSFEFSIPKNAGLTGFSIRCTYMPVNPYIRVAPIWGGLYGDSSFTDDPRGLICQGDYSLARLNDAWVQYQEQNKNYLAIFNRQIDHMDIMRKYEKIEQISNAVTGSVTGAAAGATGGALIGAGPIGAAVGGILGGATSAVAGVTDVMIGEDKYKENRSYAVDMFELNLGNVQAMPRTLSRTTAFSIDHRFFPIFSTYSCTDTETDAVINFINNRSMTVEIVDVPRNYVYNRWHAWYGGEDSDRGYIQGTILRIDTIHDTHFIDALNDEFSKGVYLR
jgi:hypothetical protein